MSFDPFKKTDSDGSSPKIDTWSNIVRLIFPHDILSSGAKNWPKVSIECTILLITNDNLKLYRLQMESRGMV